MPRKNQDKQDMRDTTQPTCKAVDCTIKPVDGSEYCANHHVENEWLKQEQAKIKYDQEMFRVENDTLLTKVKGNSISSLVDIKVVDNCLVIPLPKNNFAWPNDETRQNLIDKVSYHIMQGKKGSGKLSTSIERIEQHREHLLNAYFDALSTFDYLENGIKRQTHDKVKVDTKREMLNNTPDVALQPWATSLGIDHTLPREQIINLMMEKI